MSKNNFKKKQKRKKKAKLHKQQYRNFLDKEKHEEKVVNNKLTDKSTLDELRINVEKEVERLENLDELSVEDTEKLKNLKAALI